MSKRSSKPDHFRKLKALYAQMDREYERVTSALGFTCAGCKQNCCVSHFQHHTHIEWAYLFQGLSALDPAEREEYMARARANVEACSQALNRGERPRVMCPLNNDGLCGMYEHRLMICRLHGVPHTLRTPDGRGAAYPGCFRFEDMLAEETGLRDAPEHVAQAARASLPVLDRTPLYRTLAELEMRFVGPRGRDLPRVNMTLAEMMVSGPPPVDKK